MQKNLRIALMSSASRVYKEQGIAAHGISFDDWRHSALENLVGKSSTSELTEAEAKTAIKAFGGSFFGSTSREGEPPELRKAKYFLKMVIKEKQVNNNYVRTLAAQLFVGKTMTDLTASQIRQLAFVLKNKKKG